MSLGVSPADPWFGYVNTVVDVIRPDATDLSVRAAPAGSVGRWPWATEVPVYVLTAWDPGEERLSADANRGRQQALDAELRGLTGDIWRAKGLDPSTGYRDEGTAVRGLAEHALLDLGARYGQDAVFRWTPKEWSIVSCVGERRLVLGWTVRPGP